jgi:hypothetical protein
MLCVLMLETIEFVSTRTSLEREETSLPRFAGTPSPRNLGDEESAAQTASLVSPLRRERDPSLDGIERFLGRERKS